MEQHQKGYIRPGDLLFANRNNSDNPTPPDEHVQVANTHDATHDNTTPARAAEQIKQPTPVKDTRTDHPFYARQLHSQAANEETVMPLVSKHSIVHTKNPIRTTNAVSSPVNASDSAPIFNTTTISSSDLLEDPQRLGRMLESTYHTTSSDEIKIIIACLVNLDAMITRQTHLNELHEAHTAKNFREQRHLNKDRKVRLDATVKSVNDKFASLDAQRMAQETMIKQCEVRVNSHQLQLKALNDKTQMLAQGGEWMEAETSDTNRVVTDLRGEGEGLKLANSNLRDEVRGLREEINGLKEKNKVWERRLATPKKVVNGKKDRQRIDCCVNKQQVLNAASFAVGNARNFSFPC